MALNFPDSPSLNDTYTFNGNTWIWDGTVWIFQSPLEYLNTTFTANGALTDGDPVIIGSDGTVSSVGIETITTSAGTPVVFDNTQVSQYSSFVYSGSVVSTYDSNNQKIVIAYTDQSNSDNGMAVVGTVSGSSISFGTPVTFKASAVSDISITYDENSQKIVITYINSSSQGEAIVGTVSGTSISFGTPVVFNSGSSSFTAITYETVSQKVVVSYRDGSDTFGKSAVGTVSGTSISFGSIATFDNSDVSDLSIVYDSTAQKSVVVYKVSSAARAVVGTVSGTSISFGTPVVADSNYTNFVKSSYDKDAQRVIILSARFNDSFIDEVSVKVGTVSGTTISFGSAVQVFEGFRSRLGIIYDEYAQKTMVSYGSNNQSGVIVDGVTSGTTISFGSPVTFESSGITSLTSTYDLLNKKVINSYGDAGNSNFGTTAVITSAASVTNLNENNFIGFSNGSYNDAENALIDCIGKLNDGQSSLTISETYYVQTDGTISTTPDTPSVYAGIAVASDKIIVKG